MVLTLVLTVFVGLITAVALGLIAAGIARAKESERLELDSVVSVPLLGPSVFTRSGGPRQTRWGAGGSGHSYQARVGLVALRGRFFRRLRQ